MIKLARKSGTNVERAVLRDVRSLRPLRRQNGDTSPLSPTGGPFIRFGK